MKKFLGLDDTTLYRPDRFHEPGFNAVDRVVSSVGVQPLSPIRERVLIWSRGALAGDLEVLRGDGEILARVLLDTPETGEPSR